MSRERELEQALEACLAAARSGSTSEEALGAYPHLRDELEPLLRLAGALPEVATAAPSERFRLAARARVMATARASAARPRTPFWTLIPLARLRWASSLAVALLAVLLLGGAGVSASANALPGDLLYPVKRAAEQAELSLARDQQARQGLRLRSIDRRLGEAETLVQRGQVGRAEDALAAYAEGVELLEVEQLAVREAEHAAELAARLRERLEEHQERLRQVGEQVSPPARPALEQALERSRLGLERAAEVHERRATKPDGETPPGLQDEAPAKPAREPEVLPRKGEGPAEKRSHPKPRPKEQEREGGRPADP